MPKGIPNPFTEQAARRWAQRILGGADPDLDWRGAGYRTPRQAARALVGDYDTPEARRAAALVTAALNKAGAR